MAGLNHDTAKILRPKIKEAIHAYAAQQIKLSGYSEESYERKLVELAAESSSKDAALKVAVEALEEIGRYYGEVAKIATEALKHIKNV